MGDDEQIRVLADEVRAEHEPDGSGHCPICRKPNCDAYRLARAVLGPGVRPGPNAVLFQATDVFRASDVDGTAL